MPPVNPNDILPGQLPPQQGPQTLAGPAPQMPAMPVIDNPQKDAALAHTQADTSLTTQTTPSTVAERNAQAAITALKLRQLRTQMGLNPDTGAADPASGKVGNDAIADLSPEEQDMVKGIVTGKVPVTAYSLARGGPEMQKMVQRAYAFEPGTDLQTYARRQSAYQKYMAPNSPVVRMNQALSHLDLYQNSMMKLGNFSNASGYNPEALLNYPKVATQEFFKSPAYVAAKTNRDAAATELAAAFKGGNDPALASVDHWQNVLSMANSPEAVNGSVQAAVKLLGSRMEAMNYSAQQLMGPNAEVMHLLDPNAQKVFNKYNSDSYDSTQTVPENATPSTTEQAFTVPKGYQQDHDAFLAANKPGTLTPDAYLQFRKGEDEKYNVNSDLTPESIENYVKAYNLGNTTGAIPGQNKPLSEAGHIIAAGAESAPGQLVEGAANAGTGGLVDLAAGQTGRDTEKLAAAQHPVASGIGDVAGSIAPITGLEGLGLKGLEAIPGLAGKLSPKAMRMIADIAGNTGYGSARGFNASDQGQGGAGAVEGALAGAAGSLAGRAVTKGVTGFLPQTTEDALKAFHGVDLTTLQRLGAGKIENAFSGVPGSHGAQMDALWSMNKDRAGQLIANLKDPNGNPLTIPSNVKTPQQLNNFIYQAADNSYEQIKPQINASKTGDFETYQQSLPALVAGDANKRKLLPDIQAAINLAFDENGHITGDSFKNSMERLREVQKSYADGAENSDSPLANRDMAKMTADAATRLKQLVISQVPEKVGQQLDNTDRVWAGKMQLENATNRAKASGGIYSPGQALTSQVKFDPSVNNNLSARGLMEGPASQSGRPDQKYLLDAQRLMGNSVSPKVNPWLTGISIPSAIGATVAAPHYAVPAGAAAIAAYMPGVKRVVQKALTGVRPSVIDNRASSAAYADAIRRLITGD